MTDSYRRIWDETEPEGQVVWRSSKDTSMGFSFNLTADEGFDVRMFKRLRTSARNFLAQEKANE